jgi:Transglutaminase-like enzymes, putative cysteine proteases
MLVTLAVFFGRLFGEMNDTRLALARLLIELQVLHSFDLPRRKDLGYSMVIGLILIGVAGTLSQTLAFGPVVLVFLALALPTLILDYRSRLGLGDIQFNSKKTPQPPGSGVNFKSLGIIFLVVVSLGLTIFAVLPRFPSYQLRTFPVSSPIDLPPGQFDGQRILNPGYVSSGNNNNNNSAGSGTGLNQETGAGTLNDTFYYGFNTKINQNLRGELKPQEVLRVRSQARGFWRVVAFDRYTGQGWEISRNNRTTTLKRPHWSYQFNLFPLITNAKTQEVVQSYTVLQQLPSLIPAMNKAKEIYFPTEEIAIDPDGNLRSPLELREGMTYTVISQVPYRNRQQLQQTSTDYPPAIKKYYLQVPDQIQEQVRKKTEEILASVHQVAQNKKPLDSNYEKVLYLAQYLKQNPNYKLQQEPPFLRKHEDLVEAFLFGYQDSPPGKKITGGYPDHFSTVLTMMLRSIGIPARLVAGFNPGEFNPFTGLYVVKNTDALAMTEVYFPKYGWFAFNPIPGMDLIPPSVEENQTFSALKAFWDWVAGWLPSPVANGLQLILGTLILWLFQVIRWFFSLFTQGWLGIFSGLIITTIMGFFGWLSWDIWRGWRYRRWLAKLPPEESLYQQLLQVLAGIGYPKSPTQTPLEYASWLHQYHPISECEVIDEISQAYMGWRYGGKPVNLKQMRQLLINLKSSRWKRLKRQKRL